MTITPPGPTGRGPLRERRGLPMRWVLGVGVAVAILLLVGSGGARGWWAHRLHDATGGNILADYVIGLLVGLLPVIGVALGAWHNRGGRRLRRMFLFGAVGFLVTYVLSPSIAAVASGRGHTHTFQTEAPGYLAGVYTGVGLWVVLCVVAFLRLRASVRRHLQRYDDRFR